MERDWSRIRFVILLCVFGAVVLVIGKLLRTEGDSGDRKVEVELPDEISLQGWKTLSASELTDHSPERANYLKGKEYRYVQDSVTLTVQARYIYGTTGNVRGLMAQYLSLPPEEGEWTVREIEDIGSVLFKSERNSLSTSSCINPYGGATVSVKDYQYNRNFQDIRHRFVPWMLGGKLKDERCLWTHLSISQTNGDSSMMDSLIETAWVDWYRWWSVQLPEMEI